MKNGLTVDVEPLWYKVLSELTLNKEKGYRLVSDNIIILRQSNDGKIILGKELPKSE
jgi:hypothetical protein